MGLADNPNKVIADYAPTFVNDEFVQKIHYFNPMGQSNDIQSIVPHYKDGKIDYWDGYYLWNPNLSGNQWYHFVTKDFSQFKPYDESNPISIKNVAIPDKDFNFFETNHIEVDRSVNKRHLSWGFVATGSVMKNNTKANGGSWFNVDEWGDTIAPDAKIACFSTFDGNPSYNATYLAYSNNDEQFKPISNMHAMDATMVNRHMGDEFRDPYITTIANGTKLVAYEACGLSSKMAVLVSDNGLDWHGITKYYIDLNKIPDARFQNKMIETPFVTTISNQPIMFFGVQSEVDRSISHVGWVTGYMVDDGIFQIDEKPKYGFVDDGFDNYAGNFTKIDDDHLAYLGWMGNWGYFNGTHNGGFTLARVLTWNKDEGIKSTVIEPGKMINESVTQLPGQTSKTFNVGQKIIVDLKRSSPAFAFSLTRSDDSNNKIDFAFVDGEFTYSRKGSKNGTTDLKDVSKLINQKRLTRFVIYLDNISAEIHFPEVQKTFTIFSFGTKNMQYNFMVSEAAKVSSYDFDQSKLPDVSSLYIPINPYKGVRDRWFKTRNNVTDNDKKELVDGLVKTMDRLLNDINYSTDKINTVKDATTNFYKSIYYESSGLFIRLYEYMYSLNI